ncbi:hypothetical protein SUGI_0833740 [Cryptomeria japonica]|nr:hypothetical protein SUGI_0833740 [Cryptomeria japonica]
MSASSEISLPPRSSLGRGSSCEHFARNFTPSDTFCDSTTACLKVFSILSPTTELGFALWLGDLLFIQYQRLKETALNAKDDGSPKASRRLSSARARLGLAQANTTFSLRQAPHLLSSATSIVLP